MEEGAEEGVEEGGGGRYEGRLWRKTEECVGGGGSLASGVVQRRGIFEHSKVRYLGK